MSPLAANRWCTDAGAPAACGLPGILRSTRPLRAGRCGSGLRCYRRGRCGCCGPLPELPSARCRCLRAGRLHEAYLAIHQGRAGSIRSGRIAGLGTRHLDHRKGPLESLCGNGTRLLRLPVDRELLIAANGARGSRLRVSCLDEHPPIRGPNEHSEWSA